MTFFFLFFLKTLEFETLHSGILTAVSSPGSSLVQMRLPLNPANIQIPEESSKFRNVWEIVCRTVGSKLTSAVLEVKFSPTSGKLLIVMSEDSFSRADLESLEVVKDQLLGVVQQTDGGQYPDGVRVKGVMVTVRGEKGGKYDFISR